MIETILGFLFIIVVIFILGSISTRLENNKAIKNCNGYCLLVDGKIVSFSRYLEDMENAITVQLDRGVTRNSLEIKACKIENSYPKGDHITYVHNKY